jgi:hypothetical protein
VPRGPRTARMVSPGTCRGRLVANGVGRARPASITTGSSR